ncbi:hypothetical protein Agub_g9121 [Astrephomene gubernaculifera]|uniref:Arginyl-tRNA--protein transferase n=1 Tax=Astrephomene gubernaculifera TaxID=47775 RepID=A0AAD3HN09_9CHLO|nr:hypothetical protein Agub_g9121 [Astrephomene gubernaculifera]
MANPRDGLSMVIDGGSDGYSSCGYCNGKQCSVSHGMHARGLTVYAYQDLIDQGWRRSGTYLYKPDLVRSCCKAYTIRLDVQQFQPDKGQRRLLRKWRDFLSGSQPMAVEQGEGSAPGDAGGSNAASTDATSHASLQGAADGAAAGPQGAGAEAGAEETRALLQQLLAAALAAAVSAGELPQCDYPAPVVQLCTAKQRQSLQADVGFTSASAFQLAAAAARRNAASSEAGAPPSVAPPPSKQQRKAAAAAQAAASLSAQSVATLLTRHFNSLVAAGGNNSKVGSGEGVAASQAPTDPSSAGHASAMHFDGDGSGSAGSSCIQPMQTLLGERRPEALAAKGHINFRLPTRAVPRQDGSNDSTCAAGAAATAQGPQEDAAGTRPGARGGGASASRGPSGDGSGRRVAASTVAPGGAAAAVSAAASDPLEMPGGRLEVRLVRSGFLEEEFQLYSRYQVSQHGDRPEELSRASYKRFLVDSPLRPVGRDRDPAAPECGYGSFHQQYWLDGALAPRPPLVSPGSGANAHTTRGQFS